MYITRILLNYGLNSMMQDEAKKNIYIFSNFLIQNRWSIFILKIVLLKYSYAHIIQRFKVDLPPNMK